MKRFYAIFAAMLISICSFASINQVPDDALLADYYNQGDVCVCFFVPADIACNGIVLTGSFNGWASNAASCVAAAAIEGYDGWYVASFTPEDEPDAEKGIQAKPMMLDGSGNFNWDYQVGAATAIRGGVQIVQGGVAGEIDLINYGADAPNVFTVDQWKANPCTAIYHNYNITVVSDGCGGYVVPFIVGSMTNWQFQQMQYSSAKTAANDGIPTYEISFKAAEGTPYQIVSGKLNDAGEMEIQPAWNDDAYMQMLVDGVWSRYNPDNSFTGEEANIVYDLREADMRWARCSEAPTEHVVLFATLPSAGAPELVEVIGGFDGWTGTAMELRNGMWFVEIDATEEQFFKFRSAGSWDNELLFYNSEDNEWQPIRDYDLTFGQLWGDDTWYGVDCKMIELDLSDPEYYRWSLAPIDPATTPKLWPIMMDNETFAANSLYVTANLRVNDEISNLYIWSAGETYSAVNRGGLNFYGNNEGYLALDVMAPDGWSGAGFSVEGDQAMEAIRALANKIIDREDSIYLHIAIKSNTAGNHEFCMFGDGNISFTLGTEPARAGQLFSDFARDGEWHEFYIPVNQFASTLASTMLSYSTNILYFLSGNAVGAELDLDAIYFCNAAYKNAGTALAITSGECGDNLTWNYADSVLTISGTGAMWDYNSTTDQENFAPWRYLPVKSVMIEEGVTYIGAYAFYQCSLLTTVELPSTLSTIGFCAFYACNALTTIHAHGARPASIEWSSFYNINTYSVSVYIPFGSGSAYSNSSYWNDFNIIEPESGSGQCGENLFFTYTDSVLTITGTGDMWDYSDYSYYGYDRAPWTNHPVISVTMEEGATSIGNYAFYYTNIPSFDIPSSVTRIGRHAFSGCSGLTSVVVPDEVTSIGYAAFAWCTNLTRLYIPATVEEIDSYVLEGDINLTYLNAPASTLRGYTENRIDTLIVNSGELETYSFGSITNSSRTLRHMDLSATENTELRDEAFAHFYNMRSIVLPQGLEKINYMAIANCKSLESITIPASVTEIGMSAFEDCRSLLSVNFASGSMLTAISDWAFYNCHELQSIDIPEGVTEIGKAAFFDCVYLNDVIVPASVQVIGDNAFALCSRMQQMRVKAVVPPSIASKTFEQVSRQMPVYVPQNSVDAYKADPLWGQMNIIGADEQWSGEDNVTSTTLPTKQLIDGQLYLHHGERIYDAQGRQVK